MFSQVNIACGLDIYYSKIVGSIVTFDGTHETRTFTTYVDDTLKLKDWILNHKCERVTFENRKTSRKKPGY
jgi:hypothetical protein